MLAELSGPIGRHHGVSRGLEECDGNGYSRLNDESSREVRSISSLTAYENAVANLSAAISEAQARIAPADLPDVLSNPAQLLQVFQNLISNALHYRGAVTPHIRVSAERQNSFWLFSVSDNRSHLFLRTTYALSASRAGKRRQPLSPSS
jgi:light-regulated signal transduction histidine kinase (bacteriophytochrome)